jgi:uncharacterized protein YdaU (DUF1376 family)
MAKDPAILFYTSDFLTGTMTMNNEQVGKYIRLLCLQHQKGVLCEKDMLFICGSYDEDIWSKFEHDEHGFYNKRLRVEAEKRALYSLSRASNRSKSNNKQSKKHMKKICKTYDEHMENENINENINIINNKNINKKEKIKHLDSVLLSEQEFEKLVVKYGHDTTMKAIEILNNGIMSKGYKYKSHYHTIIGWPMKEATGGNNGNGNGSGFTGSTGSTFKKAGGAQSDGQPYPVDAEY